MSLFLIYIIFASIIDKCFLALTNYHIVGSAKRNFQPTITTTLTRAII